MFKEPTVSFEWVTPERAVEFLKNGKNRREIKPAKIEQYARDMVSGNWTISNDCITFDSQGRMHNGQNRCHAIIKSGRPVFIGIMYGVDDKGTDQGTLRKVQEVYEGVTQNTASIARTIMKVREGGRKQNPSFAEVATFIELHKQALNFVSDLFKAGKIGVTRAAVQAAVFCAYYYLPKESLERFVEVLYSGQPASPGENTIIKLRDSLISKKGAGGIDQQKEDFRKTSRVIEAFYHNEDLSRLYTPSRELFPLPERLYNV